MWPIDGRRTEDDLIAQVAAETMDDSDDFVEISAILLSAGPALLPPFAQYFTLRELLLKQLISLFQGLTVIGNTCIYHGSLRNKVQQIGVVAQIRQLDALEILLQFRELRKQCEIFIAILAPGDLLPNWDLSHAGAGGHLIAGLQHCLASGLGHLHCAFDHRDTRTLNAGVHRENRARDRHARIRSFDVEMSRAALGRLDNDDATRQINRGVSPADRHVQLAASIHFDE